MIKAVKGGNIIVHCSGKNKGKRIPGSKPRSKAKTLRQHRAIMANKKGK